jgi:subtilisin family serine protease
VRRSAVALAAVLAVAALPARSAVGIGKQVPAATSSSPRQLLRRQIAPWARGRLLVEFRPGVPRTESARVLAGSGAKLRRSIPSLGVDVLELDADTSVLEAVARLSASPLVRSAQPDWLLLPQETVPTDERFPDQWSLRNKGQRHPIAPGPGSRTSARGATDADVDAGRAWDVQKGKPSTVVAILDAGVDVDHRDIAANLWTNPREGADGGDGDRNGYRNDVHGWDFAEDDASVLEKDEDIAGVDHGTHVAGVAAGVLDGSTGIVGACPRCSIMVLKFMKPIDTDGQGGPDTMAGFQSAELEALAYARREGADVLNASFGTPSWSMLERRSYQRLVRAGVLPVVAAGNWNGDNDMYIQLDFNGDGFPDSLSPFYPASYDLEGLVSVAASNHADRYGYNTACAMKRGSPRWPCTFTNWGHDSVDFAAPGVDIVSSVPDGGYDTFNGTSMAAPLVTGVAGLVKSRHPRWEPIKIKSALMNSVGKPVGLRRLYAIPGLRPRRGGFTRTSGRINARRALTASGATRYRRTDSSLKRARALGGKARGELRWPRDVNDVFKKRLPKGRRYTATLRGPRRGDFDLYAYKPGTKEIWQIEVACFTGGRACKLLFARSGRGSRARARFRARRGGLYYFQVSSVFARGKYTLRVARGKG